jgi:hypothetical protein
MKRLFRSLRRFCARKHSAREARRPQGNTVRLDALELERRDLPSAGPFAFNPLELPTGPELGQMFSM